MENYLEQEFYELIKKENPIFEFLQQSSLDGLWFWDLENPKLGWMNEKFWAELGYSPDQIPVGNSSWQNVVHEEDLEASYENFNKHLEDPNHPYDLVIRHKHRDGHTVWIRTKGKAIRNEHGKPVRMYGSHHNITEIMRTNELLNSKIEELEQFTYAVSHDLKAPLRIISGYAGILSEDYGNKLDKEGIRIINNILDNVDQMNILIQELLSFSRISQQKMKTSPLNTEQLIKESMITSLAAIDSEDFEINIAKDIPPTYGDRSMLKQLFTNLINNAIKYSSKSEIKRIDITWSSVNSNRLEIVFKDYGCGFDMKYYDKVFAVFQRLHSQQEYEGNGIGLALCKRIMEKHNGKIFALSEPGEGSEFHIVVPKYTEEFKPVEA